MVMDMRLPRSQALNCECGVGVEECVCTYSPQQVDLLTPSLKAAPHIVTSHIDANGSQRPTLTHMMDRITMAIELLPQATKTEYTLDQTTHYGKEHGVLWQCKEVRRALCN